MKRLRLSAVVFAFVAGCSDPPVDGSEAGGSMGSETSGDGETGTSATDESGGILPGECGNSIIELGEDCDDGRDGDNDDGCTDACRVPSCGDGYIQQSLAEHCDDGNDDDDDACTSTCTAPEKPAWTRTHSGAEGGADGAGDVAIDAAGNVVAIGWVAAGADGYDIWVSKFGPDGATLWSATHNGPNPNSYDFGHGITVDSADNVIAAGVETTGGGQSRGAWVRKYDPQGAVLWTNVHHGPEGLGDEAWTVAVDAADAVIVGGFENLPAWIAKYDADGGETWSKTFGGSGNFDVVWQLTTDSANDIYATGSLDDDVWVQKLTSDGVPVWSDGFHTGTSSLDSGAGIAVDGEGHVYVVGSTQATWVRKYDGNGREMWTKMFAGAESTTADVVLAAGGGFLLIGTEPPTQSGSQAWIRKVDADGALQWKQLYPGLEGVSTGGGIGADTAGRFAATGTEQIGLFDSDIWVRLYQ